MTTDGVSSELLRAVVRRPSDETRQHVRHLVSQVGDWDSLLHMAQEHRVTSVLFLKLKQLDIATPADVQNLLMAGYERNAFQSIANAAELIDLLGQFQHEKISAMPFKGILLGASVYHDLAIRPAGDLDVLIHYRDLLRATALLVKRGYELKTPAKPDGTPKAPDYFEYHFERPADGMVLELRWRLELSQPRFRRDLGMDWVWPHRCETELAGAKVPDIRPEILLLVLCMHASKHVWSRLIWICDVAQLLETHPSLDWDEVIAEARRTGLWRALALGVLLAHRIADVGIPSIPLSKFTADKTAARLAEHICSNLFTAPGSMPRGAVPYYFQLLDLSDRLAMIFSLNFLRPNERDRAVMRLPESLSLLYYLIRPYRIMRDRSAR
ncbi:MAG TPA: nucleotidyltransferase family protein [Terracidiphilus sp.]|nr:nucleotidyltransferase family protein [Terracidiphilus sp.]